MSCFDKVVNVDTQRVADGRIDRVTCHNLQILATTQDKDLFWSPVTDSVIRHAVTRVDDSGILVVRVDNLKSIYET